MSRVGAGLVGIDPTGTTAPAPALTLTAPVVGTRRVRAGTSVGYGHAWRADATDDARRCCRSATPTGCRARPSRPRPGVAAPAGGARSSAGSRWTRSSSTSATTPVLPGDGRHGLRARSPRRADGRRVGGAGPAPSSTRSSPASAPGWPARHEPRHATRVAVIGGGASCEHEVSLAIAAAVAAALDPARYEVVRLTIDPHGTWLDGGGRPVGLTGADLPPAPLRRRAARSCTDRTARTARSPRCATSPACRTSAPACAPARWPWTSGRPSSSPAPSASPPRPGVLLTPRHRGGVRLDPPGRRQARRRRLEPRRRPRRRPGDLDAALAAAFALDDRVLVEDVVVGREVDVAVLGRPDGSRVVAPTLEIVTDGLFGHEEKYGGTADFRIPADLDETDTKTLEDAAVAVYDALGCAGVARVDFFLDRRRPGAQRGQHDARASPSTRRCRGCSPPPGSRTPTSSTCSSATPWLTAGTAP